jgi:sensor histidine kinase regulating citrate/malate metabolism
VKDTGTGIESNEIELIVRRHHHSPNSSGFGPGLYQVKSICDTYMLELEIKSTVGEGSEFLIYFPENMIAKAPASE